MTTALSKAYGEHSYIVNFAAMAGQYREFRDGTVRNIPTLSEQHLAKKLKVHFNTAPHAIFIEPKQFNNVDYKDLVLHGHEYGSEHWIPIHLWRNHFDSTFLINKVTASN